MHLPVPIFAVCPDDRTCQALQFSYGVVPVHVSSLPPSWSSWVKQFARRNHLVGAFAILAEKVPTADLRGNYRMEIVNL